MRDTFPIWPSTSPQDPHVIYGRQVAMMIQDLRINQVPRGNSTEMPFRQVLRAQQGAVQGRLLTPEMRYRAKLGSNLYDLLLATEAAPREELVRAMRSQ